MFLFIFFPPSSVFLSEFISFLKNFNTWCVFLYFQSFFFFLLFIAQRESFYLEIIFLLFPISFHVVVDGAETQLATLFLS